MRQGSPQLLTKIGWCDVRDDSEQWLTSRRMVYADGMRVLVGAEGEYRRRVVLIDLSPRYIHTVSRGRIRYAAAALGLGAFHGAADGAGGEGCYC